MLKEKRLADGTLYIFDKIIPQDSLSGRMITKLIAPNAVEIKDDAIYRCLCLREIQADKLKKIGDNIVEDCPELVRVQAPLLEAQNIVFIGSFFIDLNAKRVLNLGNFDSSFVRVLNEEFEKGKTLKVVEKENGTRILKLDENEILKEREGQIVGICLPTCETLPSHALYENNFVEELVLLSATQIDHNAIYKSKALKRVVADKVEHIRFSNFSRCPNLTDVELAELVSMESGCFCLNDKFSKVSFNKLESVEKNCFCHLPLLETFCLKKAIAVGESSIQHNKNLKAVLLPALLELEPGVLYGCGVEYLYAPKIKEKAVRIGYLKNARRIMKGKSVLKPEYSSRIKE